MPCYRPLRAWQEEESDQVVFKAPARGRELQLPCGKCIGCTSSRASMWALRCYHESLMHERNSFVTLTYDDEHIPPDHSLVLRHWQLFRKKLYEQIGPFRFFMGAEYGGRTLRPHYHFLLFGEDFSVDRTLLKRTEGRPLWTSPLLERTWGNGNVSLGLVTPETCAYVTKYCVKKQRSLHSRVERVDSETGEVWTVIPEFQTMSRRPGLGARWFERYATDVYPSDQVVMAGRTHRPPRFYDERLRSLPPDASGRGLGPDMLEELKSKRRAAQALREEEGSPRRLATRERVAEARLGLKRS